jgi:hypothetical protein
MCHCAVGGTIVQVQVYGIFWSDDTVTVANTRAQLMKRFDIPDVKEKMASFSSHLFAFAGHACTGAPLTVTVAALVVDPKLERTAKHAGMYDAFWTTMRSKETKRESDAEALRLAALADEVQTPIGPIRRSQRATPRQSLPTSASTVSTRPPKTTEHEDQGQQAPSGSHCSNPVPTKTLRSVSTQAPTIRKTHHSVLTQTTKKLLMSHPDVKDAVRKAKVDSTRSVKKQLLPAAARKGKDAVKESEMAIKMEQDALQLREEKIAQREDAVAEREHKMEQCKFEANLRAEIFAEVNAAAETKIGHLIETHKDELDKERKKRQADDHADSGTEPPAKRATLDGSSSTKRESLSNWSAYQQPLAGGSSGCGPPLGPPPQGASGYGPVPPQPGYNYPCQPGYGPGPPPGWQWPQGQWWPRS